MKQSNANILDAPAAAKGYSNEERQRFLKTFQQTDRFLSIASNPLLHTFIRQVSHLPEVVAVCFRQEDNTMHVWTILESPERSVEHQVYAGEMKLMESFPEIVFDFHVIFLSDRDLPTVLPPDSEIIYTRG